jgi:signal transduction histidine kinase
MRLGPKIFLTSIVLIAILLAVAGWSLWAVQRLVAANRAILTETLPALQSVSALREALPALVRLETRYVVLGDAEYWALWTRRIEGVREELERLEALMTTEAERQRLAEVRGRLAAYGRVVERERLLLAQGKRVTAGVVMEAESRPAAELAEAAAARLATAIQGAAGDALARARALERRTWTAVTLALVAGVAAALGGTAWVAARLTRALRVLSAATRQVAEGSFQEPLRVESRDEVADLAGAFNRMAARLREVEQLKEEFFSSISHELRTPLTSIREGVQLLREGAHGPLTPKQERLLAVVGVSTDRLLRLINQILDLSRLRAGLLPLERRWVDLDRLAARALDELRPQAEEKGVALGRAGAGAAVKVLADEERVLEMLVNLLGNAVKFTPPGGRVTVGVEEREGEAVLTVADTGIGIPPDALPRIFERYQQAHRGKGGSGLGLAIVKALAEAHGGRVAVESEEGTGSRFTVLLPRNGAAP